MIAPGTNLHDLANGGIQDHLDELADDEMRRAYLTALHDALVPIETMVHDVRRDLFAAIRALAPMPEDMVAP